MHYAILSIILLTITACSQIRPEYPSSRDTQPNTVFEDSKNRQISPSGNLLQLNYEGFIVWLDCEKRSAMKFQYNTA
jgi:endonuclease G